MFRLKKYYEDPNNASKEISNSKKGEIQSNSKKTKRKIEASIDGLNEHEIKEAKKQRKPRAKKEESLINTKKCNIAEVCQ